MAGLELTDIWCGYGSGPPVVRGVSLAVSDGEVMTVLGPSGCGKSTLLRVIAGLERPQRGEVRIDGERVTGLEPKDRDVAMVFQSYALYPHLRVFDNIAVSLRLRGTAPDRIRQVVEATADRLGIRRHLRSYPRELSGGERQRVALARALVRRPKLFLLDEPLSNLDAQLRERARAELRATFASERATVVYVTHDQIEALTLSDRIAVMNAGRIEQVGGPQEIYDRPATVFVAGFVGSPRMNLLPGALLGDPAAATVGFRPEDVRLSGTEGTAMAVVLREPLGSQQLWTLRGGELELRVLVAADQPPSPSARVVLDPARAHRFDAAGIRMPL